MLTSIIHCLAWTETSVLEDIYSLHWIVGVSEECP